MMPKSYISSPIEYVQGHNAYAEAGECPYADGSQGATYWYEGYHAAECSLPSRVRPVAMMYGTYSLIVSTLERLFLS